MLNDPSLPAIGPMSRLTGLARDARAQYGPTEGAD